MAESWDPASLSETIAFFNRAFTMGSTFPSRAGCRPLRRIQRSEIPVGSHCIIYSGVYYRVSFSEPGGLSAAPVAESKERPHWAAIECLINEMHGAKIRLSKVHCEGRWVGKRMEWAGGRVDGWMD